ncbi:MAG: hypothetical protein LBJ02_12145 [Bifidobacteriaceae bacterium]|jgi:hypothetical protein|nr:hypothetical protein [Bifidobacteriaceae bacterium]
MTDAKPSMPELPRRPGKTAGPVTGLTCASCGGNQFTVLDDRLGRARCDYCETTVTDQAAFGRPAEAPTPAPTLPRPRPAAPAAGPQDTALAEAIGRGLMSALVFDPARRLRLFLRRLWRRTLITLVVVVILALILALVYFNRDQIAAFFS